MITWTKRLILTLSFLALIATNILALTNMAFNAAVSGLMGTAFGIQTVSDVLRSKADVKARTAKRKVAVRRFGARLTARTKRVAAESIAAIPGEAIPFFGITLLVAGTGYELYEACNSIKDLDRLYSDMGMEDETPDDVMHSVCHPTMPEAGNVWDEVVEKSGEWLDQARAAM